MSEKLEAIKEFCKEEKLNEFITKLLLSAKP